ncbi:hypothetical protein WN55_00240 [Dufourea novaeangliae]|uniref:Uncharacterized protein n=1 Tax=Dufourea novaeangliae TaxID=178035 RepID=A0A154PE63_DUFNO|nr:hypothetical protein WN55_00240 [Dufourea novaeangliae]
MDLVYVPEVLTYGYLRSLSYRDYEQPWNTNYFNNGRSMQNYCQRLPQQHHEEKQLSKENCHLCRESKRRSLAAYIRGKSRKSSCKEIHEEEEEQDTANVNEESSNGDNQASKVENENTKRSSESKKTKEK